MSALRKQGFSPKFVRSHEKSAPATIVHYQDKLKKSYSSPLLLMRSLLHKNESGGIRRLMRADGQKNLYDVLHVLLDHTDLNTLIIGEPYTNAQGQKCYYTDGIVGFARKSGVNPFTVKRHLATLERLGYMEEKVRWGYDKDGTKIRLYSLRRFTKKLFFELDGGHAFNTSRKYVEKKIAKSSQEKLKSIMSEAAQSIPQRTRYGFTSILSTGKPVNPAPKPQNDFNPSLNKQLLDQAAYIAQRDNRNPMDVLKELKTRLSA